MTVRMCPYERRDPKKILKAKQLLITVSDSFTASPNELQSSSLKAHLFESFDAFACLWLF